MDAFPIFIDLRGRNVVVVGGGAVAARKAALLARAGARILVIAAAPDPAFAPLLADGRCVHRAESFRRDHLVGATLAIAADPDPSVNEDVARAGRAMAVPVNVVDRPELCSFTVPAIVDRSPVVVAISTGGAAPVLARALRTRLEACLPAAYGKLAALAAAHRPLVRRRLPDARIRRRFWEAVFEGGIADLVFAGRVDIARWALRRMLDRAVEDGDPSPTGVVHIVVDYGDPDLLSLRALHLLQAADVIVYDRAVAAAVLDLARREAERILIDAPHGAQASFTTDRLLARLAHVGWRVVRLVGDARCADRNDRAPTVLADAAAPVEAMTSIASAGGTAAADVRIAGTLG